MSDTIIENLKGYFKTVWERSKPYGPSTGDSYILSKRDGEFISTLAFNTGVPFVYAYNLSDKRLTAVTDPVVDFDNGWVYLALDVPSDIA